MQVVLVQPVDSLSVHLSPRIVATAVPRCVNLRSTKWPEKETARKITINVGTNMNKSANNILHIPSWSGNTEKIMSRAMDGSRIGRIVGAFHFVAKSTRDKSAKLLSHASHRKQHVLPSSRDTWDEVRVNRYQLKIPKSASRYYIGLLRRWI